MKIADDIKQFYANFKTLLENSINKEFDHTLPEPFTSDSTTPPEEYTYYQTVLFSYYQICRLIDREVDDTLKQKYWITPTNISMINRAVSIWRDWDLENKNQSEIQKEVTTLFNNIDDLTWAPKIDDEKTKKFVIDFISILVVFKNTTANNFKHKFIPDQLIQTICMGITQYISTLKIRLKNYFYKEQDFHKIAKFLDHDAKDSKIRVFEDYSKIEEWLALTQIVELNRIIENAKTLKKQIEAINLNTKLAFESEKDAIERKTKKTMIDHLLIEIYDTMVSQLEIFSLYKLGKIILLNNLIERLENRKKEIADKGNSSGNTANTVEERKIKFRLPKQDCHT